MIAGIATLCLRIVLRLALKERTRHVVEQHLVLDCKQLATALRQMRFEGGLVSEQMIEGAVETILVDLLIAELQQIAQRCATVPVLGNVQLARRPARQPARLPSSPRWYVPGPLSAVACTAPQGRFRARVRAPGTHRQTDASVRCECPSDAPALSNRRYRL